MNTTGSSITKDESTQNVAIMEFLYHWDYFITHYEILKKKYNLFLIVGKEFKDTLIQNYDFIFDQNSHLVLDQFDCKKIADYIRDNNIDKVFMPTIQGLEFTYQVSRLKTNAEFYFTIHNFDRWLGKSSFIGANGTKLIHEINRIYKSLCVDILERSSGVITIDQNVKDYIEDNYDFMRTRIHMMPWKTNQSTISEKETSSATETVFTVPASVDGQRRNYGVILETFKHVLFNHKDVRLVLLGRPIGDYGKDVLNYCHSINLTLNREAITFFEGFIHQKIYEKNLLQTDYFILPVFNKNVIGKYKASAAMYDAILAGRPILVPHDLHFSENFINIFGDSFMVYEDLYETIKFILSEMDSSKLNKIKSAAIENANIYHIENQNIIL